MSTIPAPSKTEKTDDKWESSPTYLAHLSELSIEQRPPFRELVQWYRFSQLKRGRHPFVSYSICADLIRAGWRMGGAS